MTETWVFDRNEDSLSAFGEKIPCINVVRERRLHDPEDVRYTCPPDGSAPQPYMPSLFPKGVWNVYSVQSHPSSEPYLYPFYFATDAHQMVEKWNLDNGGGYDSKTGIFVPDSAYGLHHAGSSRTTLGCLNLYHGYPDDQMIRGMNWLRDTFVEFIANKGDVKLQVK